MIDCFSFPFLSHSLLSMLITLVYRFVPVTLKLFECRPNKVLSTYVWVVLWKNQSSFTVGTTCIFRKLLCTFCALFPTFFVLLSFINIPVFWITDMGPIRGRLPTRAQSHLPWGRRPTICSILIAISVTHFPTSHHHHLRLLKYALLSFLMFIKKNNCSLYDLSVSGV